MKLSTRLVLLVLGCLLPVLTAQIYSQVNLHAARQEQISGLALRQAAMANADLGSIASAVGQLATTLVQFPDVLASGQKCSDHLRAIHASLPQYRFLTIFNRDGDRVCGSGTAPDGWVPQHRSWITGVAATTNAEVGALISGPNGGYAFLPVGVRLADPREGAGDKILVVGLDPDWVTKHLDAAQSDHLRPMPHGSLTIVDRTGAVIARLPNDHEATGRMLPEWLMPLISRDTQGVELVTDPAGHTYLAAYVPAHMPPFGLAVIETTPILDVTADVDRATYQDLLVLGVAATMALLLAWVAGRRFIYQPTEALLRAARRWREGDLTARASLADPGSEFAALAQSFNAMAAGLQAREMERRLQASYLEAQVEERTRALSESNNRLQVEIAGREKTEAALHQAQKLQAVGQLAGGIAHDFNNMLATVLGNLELMERQVGQTDKTWDETGNERMMRLITRAISAVQRGSQLTSRLLAFSRRQRLAARPIDINALLRDMITLAVSTLGRRVQVEAELLEDLWPAMVDPSQVEAAVLNLCLNARDAMPEGGKVTIMTTNVVVENAADHHVDHHLKPGAYIHMCISDTGCGMAPDVRARAFDPFFTTKGPAGSGLGLSQVYGMAQQTGGGVTIDSTPGEGTRVHLYLPRADEAAQTDAPASPDAKRQFAAAAARRDLVLIVDDDNEVRQVTVEMVRDLGCDVAEAAGGGDALTVIEELDSPPDLILLDYAMPGMNGLQLAREIRANGFEAPIALVTGYAELSDADLATGQLAGLLHKPFTILDLERLLSQLRSVTVEQTAEAVMEPGLTGS